MCKILRIIINSDFYVYLKKIFVCIEKFFEKITNKKWLPIIISLFSLGVSIYVAFKSEISPFNLKISINSYVLSEALSGPNDLYIILPMQFINDGYGEGIVEDVRLELIFKDGQSTKFPYFLEINFKEYLFNQFDIKSIWGETPPTIFAPFVLEGKTAKLRTLIFQKDFQRQFSWKPGDYQTNVFVKAYSDKKYRMLKSFKIKITDKNLLTLTNKGKILMRFDEEGARGVDIVPNKK